MLYWYCPCAYSFFKRTLWFYDTCLWHIQLNPSVICVLQVNFSLNVHCLRGKKHTTFFGTLIFKFCIGKHKKCIIQLLFNITRLFWFPFAYTKWKEFEDTKARGNQNPCIKEEQTTQCPKEKVQKDKQRSTKHTVHIKLKIE